MKRDGMREKELLDYWLILYRKKWLILFVILMAMLTAGVASYFLTPVYEARTVFFVPRSPDVLSFLSQPEGTLLRSPLLPQVSEEPHSPYIGILKSKTIRELVQKDFPHKSLNDLRSDVDFSLSEEYMIRVDSRDENPENAAGIANAFVHYLNELLDTYSRSLVTEHQVTIGQDIAETKKQLDGARQALKEFQEQNNVLVPEAEKKRLMVQKASFQAKLESASVGLKENESKTAALQEQLKKESELYVSSDLILGSALLVDLRRKLSDTEIKMASLKVDIKESHPDYKVLQNQYDRIKKNINLEIERLAKSQIKGPESSYETMRRNLVNLLVEKERIKASIRACGIVIGRIEEKLMKMPELLFKQDSLEMEIGKYKKMLQTLEVKLEEAKMQEKRDPQDVVIVEKAVPPSQPSFPSVGMNLFVAGLCGLIAGILFTFFVNYLEETREQRIFRLVRAIEASEGDGGDAA
jgi:succinoglycan biosynthesis transport protein ExoP